MSFPLNLVVFVHILGFSKAPLKSQAHQSTNLFTSAATNQRGCPKGRSFVKLRSYFQRVRGDRVLYCIQVFIIIVPLNSHRQTEALLVRLAPRKETSFKK